MRSKAGPVFVAERAGAVGEPQVAGFRIAKFYAALIGKSFLRRIKHLQEVERCAAAGNGTDPLLHHADLGEAIADYDDLGEAPNRRNIRPCSMPLGRMWCVCERKGESVG